VRFRLTPRVDRKSLSDAREPSLCRRMRESRVAPDWVLAKHGLELAPTGQR
jgi:hypothetical protein